MCVEFVGLPGTGKTTFSRVVSTELESRGVHITEPIREIDARPGVRRVLSKARFAATHLYRWPRTGAAQIRTLLDTDQQSLSDLVRVGFNFHYVTGVVIFHEMTDGVRLLDQGPYQGLWSIGLRSSQKWTELLDRFDGQLGRATPDLVVFVEANESTIAERLRSRTNDDTRFRPDSADFDRGKAGYRYLKEMIQTAEGGPRSIVVENETRDDLESNAVRIADAIQSFDADEP